MRFGLIGCGWIVERNHAPTIATVETIDVVAIAGQAYPAYGEDGRRAIEATLAAYAADARSSWIDLPIPPDDPLYARGVAALV